MNIQQIVEQRVNEIKKQYREEFLKQLQEVEKEVLGEVPSVNIPGRDPFDNHTITASKDKTKDSYSDGSYLFAYMDSDNAYTAKEIYFTRSKELFHTHNVPGKKLINKKIINRQCPAYNGPAMFEIMKQYYNDIRSHNRYVDMNCTPQIFGACRLNYANKNKDLIK